MGAETIAAAHASTAPTAMVLPGWRTRKELTWICWLTVEVATRDEAYGGVIWAQAFDPPPRRQIP